MVFQRPAGGPKRYRHAQGAGTTLPRVGQACIVGQAPRAGPAARRSTDYKRYALERCFVAFGVFLGFHRAWPYGAAYLPWGLV